ncbi:hypothetical protein NLS1_24560 [Nocardioides sp. LS1]|nr:hypothetical protein NLS1_24560 [Nocardioides sp. LS1]
MQDASLRGTTGADPVSLARRGLKAPDPLVSARLETRTTPGYLEMSGPVEKRATGCPQSREPEAPSVNRVPFAIR